MTTRVELVDLAHALRLADLEARDGRVDTVLAALRADLASGALGARARDVEPLVGLATDARDHDDPLFLADVLEHLLASEVA